MQPKPTVYVVDDDEAMRNSLRWLIESVGLDVETHAEAREFLDAYDGKNHGCLVLDLRMPGMSGLELQDALASRNMAIPIIFITAHGEVPAAVRAMKGGAVDFISKPFSDQLLLDRIQQAIDLDALSLQERTEQMEVSARLALLSDREREVLEMVVTGSSNKITAKHLGLSTKTVEVHRSHIMKKLKAASLSDLVRLCIMAKVNKEVPDTKSNNSN
jgi:FixJ family two-component response regulator